MPARVRGCPITVMWVYRLGAEKVKRMLFIGVMITGREAADMGLVTKPVPAKDLDDAVEELTGRMATVPINQAIEQTGMM
ncbi:MAG: enoyl-CoA hydratase [Paracoccaceae bacterium]|jgi:enoyl-CoA hydratase